MQVFYTILSTAHFGFAVHHIIMALRASDRARSWELSGPPDECSLVDARTLGQHARGERNLFWLNIGLVFGNGLVALYWLHSALAAL